VSRQRIHLFNATHCLRAGCDTWSYEPIEHGFIVIIWGGVETAYCSTDCLLVDVAARTAPTEVIFDG
jgi:hypothetical protein